MPKRAEREGSCGLRRGVAGINKINVIKGDVLSREGRSRDDRINTDDKLRFFRTYFPSVGLRSRVIRYRNARAIADIRNAEASRERDEEDRAVRREVSREKCLVARNN